MLVESQLLEILLEALRARMAQGGREVLQRQVDSKIV
jgi:hypothetical protein